MPPSSKNLILSPQGSLGAVSGQSFVSSSAGAGPTINPAALRMRSTFSVPKAFSASLPVFPAAQLTIALTSVAAANRPATINAMTISELIMTPLYPRRRHCQARADKRLRAKKRPPGGGPFTSIAGDLTHETANETSRKENEPDKPGNDGGRQYAANPFDGG